MHSTLEYSIHAVEPAEEFTPFGDKLSNRVEAENPECILALIYWKLLFLYSILIQYTIYSD